MSCEPDDVIWWSRPEDEAVPRVLESRHDRPVLEPEQERVDDQLLEVRTEELFLLLRVTLLAVCGVDGLDLLLCVVMPPFSQHALSPGFVCDEVSYRIIVAGLNQGIIWIVSWLDYNSRQIL